ncbi:MAG: hypothetical protein ACR2GO_04325, partial [Candidatus Limnocylindria bacterium]
MPIKSDPRRLLRRNHYLEGPGVPVRGDAGWTIGWIVADLDASEGRPAKAWSAAPVGRRRDDRRGLR